MVKEYKYGLMELNMRGNGKETRLMEKGPFGILMVISLKESGRKIKQMVTASIHIAMEPDMKDIGKMIYNTGME
jgi:hypothetical protein